MRIHAGPWSRADVGSGGVSRLARLGAFAADRFRELGVTLGPRNRLDVAQRVVAEMQKRPVTPQDSAAVERATDALRTLWDFTLIASTAPEGHAPTLTKLDDMLTGALLAREDKNTRGRNTQFELSVGAMLCLGDVEVYGEEPDLRFLLDGQERGLAVKRLTSAKKLAARVSKGVRQLQAHGVDGLVVVNVEPFLDGLRSEGTAAELGREFDRRVAPLDRLLPKLAGKPRLLGVLGMGTVPEWLFDGPRPCLSLGWFVRFRWLLDDPREQVRAEAFVQAFERKLEERMLAIFGPP